MAVPGIGTVYRDLSTDLREDVLAIMYQVDDVKTPAFDLFEDGDILQPYHQWERRSLSLRQDNAVPEGDVYAFTGDTIQSVREHNVTQIMKKEVRITRTRQKSAGYAVNDKRADELIARLTELKTDYNHALITSSLASGNASTARRMRGIVWALTLGSNQHTIDTANTLTVDTFNDMLQFIWANGPEASTVLVNGTLKRRISEFTNGTSKYTTTRNFKDRQFVQVVDYFESDFGNVDIFVDRSVPSGPGTTKYIIALDPSMFRKCWIDAPFTEPAAKVADSTDDVILCEGTLEYGHPNAGGWMAIN